MTARCRPERSGRDACQEGAAASVSRASGVRPAGNDVRCPAYLTPPQCRLSGPLIATDCDDESAQATTPVCRTQEAVSKLGGRCRSRPLRGLSRVCCRAWRRCMRMENKVDLCGYHNRPSGCLSPPRGPTKKQQMESKPSGDPCTPPGARAWRPDVGCKAMAASPRARSMRATPQGMAEARFRGRKAPRALARNPFFSGALPFLRVRRAAPPGGGASGLGGVMEPAGARVVAAALAGDGVGQTAQRAQTAGGRRALCRCAVPSKAPRGGEPRANSAPLRCVAGASATPLPNAMSFDSKRRRWRERRGLHTSCVPVPSCGARMCSALSRRAQGPYLRHRDFGRDPSTWYASLRPRLARARGSAALSAARLRVV